MIILSEGFVRKPERENRSDAIHELYWTLDKYCKSRGLKILVDEDGGISVVCMHNSEDLMRSSKQIGTIRRMATKVIADHQFKEVFHEYGTASEINGMEFEGDRESWTYRSASDNTGTKAELKVEIVSNASGDYAIAIIPYN